MDTRLEDAGAHTALVLTQRADTNAKGSLLLAGVLTPDPEGSTGPLALSQSLGLQTSVLGHARTPAEQSGSHGKQ